ncbi:hypothetical protein [Geothrix sp. PMB-07]|uniref:hypothetical protein n=1 Tax=Geothrix sp. PMB-07 TaxID=3068640 RepID=UPI00274255CE|nr:hypothetical protein [Geothrix sp. PMB-07]WLT30885.1 hypothetical protein Q9293_14290 [Geothrix sp. PMB-07]
MLQLLLRSLHRATRMHHSQPVERQGVAHRAPQSRATPNLPPKGFDLSIALHHPSCKLRVRVRRFWSISQKQLNQPDTTRTNRTHLEFGWQEPPDRLLPAILLDKGSQLTLSEEKAPSNANWGEQT